MDRVGDLGQTSLDNDMEQATVLAASMSPATTEVLSSLKSVNLIIDRIFKSTLTLIQNLPQRGSDVASDRHLNNSLEEDTFAIPLQNQIDHKGDSGKKPLFKGTLNSHRSDLNSIVAPKKFGTSPPN